MPNLPQVSEASPGANIILNVLNTFQDRFQATSDCQSRGSPLGIASVSVFDQVKALDGAKAAQQFAALLVRSGSRAARPQRSSPLHLSLCPVGHRQACAQSPWLLQLCSSSTSNTIVSDQICQRGSSISLLKVKWHSGAE